jgi:4a-hydroxytetrahydrobiopterin dehydratase
VFRRLFVRKRLADRKCDPCLPNDPPLATGHAGELLKELEDGWIIVDNHHLTKLYKFDDFASALHFVNQVGRVADEIGHHPDVHLSWGQVSLDIWTHVIEGLTENDFILAAKCDREHARL